MRDTNILVEKLADIPLLFQPGTRWHYSFSTDVLGQLIERNPRHPLLLPSGLSLEYSP